MSWGKIRKGIKKQKKKKLGMVARAGRGEING